MLEYKAGRQAKSQPRQLPDFSRHSRSAQSTSIVFNPPGNRLDRSHRACRERFGAAYKSDRFPLKALGEGYILEEYRRVIVKVLYNPDSGGATGIGIVGPRASETLFRKPPSQSKWAQPSKISWSPCTRTRMSESLMEAARWRRESR